MPALACPKYGLITLVGAAGGCQAVTQTWSQPHRAGRIAAGPVVLLPSSPARGDAEPGAAAVRCSQSIVGLSKRWSLHHSHHLQMVDGWPGHCGKDGALILPAEMSRHPCPMLFSLDKVPIMMPAQTGRLAVGDIVVWHRRSYPSSGYRSAVRSFIFQESAPSPCFLLSYIIFHAVAYKCCSEPTA